MKKFLLFSLVVLFVIGVVLSPRNVSAKTEPRFELPANAVKVADGLYYLGQKTDPTSHREVDGYAVVDFQRAVITCWRFIIAV